MARRSGPDEIGPDGPPSLTPESYRLWEGTGYRWRVTVDGLDVTLACQMADRVRGCVDAITSGHAQVRLDGAVRFDLEPVAPSNVATSNVDALVVARVRPAAVEAPVAAGRRAVTLEDL